MPRFNLLFHGMHLFVEGERNNITVLTPDIDDHTYLRGLPEGTLNHAGGLQCVMRSLKPYAKGDSFELSGPAPSGASLMSLISPIEHIVIKYSEVTIRSDKARNIFTLPMPDLIRCYRATEVDVNLALGATNRALFVRPPAYVHEITCFSWPNVPQKTRIRLGNIFDKTMGSTAINYCIYAQTTADGAEAQGAHDTGLNELLIDRDGNNTDLWLSQLNVSDGTCIPGPTTGLNECMLKSLYEMGPGFHNKLGGCGGTVVVRP